MTEADWKTLGERAVRCQGWRWSYGMKRLGDWWIEDSGGDDPARPEPSWIPDLRDPGTVGHTLALVRESLADPSVSVLARPGACDALVWLVFSSNPRTIGVHAGGELHRCFAAGTDEATALVAALETAP
jgi:hypothetical protein